MALFLNDWNVEAPLEEMAYDFDIKVDVLKSINIIVATYTYENYNGEAFVLFEEDGVLYEVNGGHCSCYGLEGQWQPEEVNLDELEQRFTLKEGQRYCQGYEYSSFTGTYNVYALEVLEAITEVRKLQQTESDFNA